ncbi:hypothetical protein [Streptomyces sp. uw30]|uniref:hypothetical protein n=1 Tax=Streptomyces sp. uw30 TaxID=1828179 RepID=UPI0011CE128B|nr:hypothetical protein [Streptomyces sp. uw30]
MLQMAGGRDGLIVVVRQPDVPGLVLEKVDDGVVVHYRVTGGLDLGQGLVEGRGHAASPLPDAGVVGLVRRLVGLVDCDVRDHHRRAAG